MPFFSEMRDRLLTKNKATSLKFPDFPTRNFDRTEESPYLDSQQDKTTWRLPGFVCAKANYPGVGCHQTQPEMKRPSKILARLAETAKRCRSRHVPENPDFHRGIIRLLSCSRAM